MIDLNRPLHAYDADKIDKGIIVRNSKKGEKLDALDNKIATLFEPALLTGKDLISAGRQQEANLSSWEVTLSFNKDGTNCN